MLKEKYCWSFALRKLGVWCECNIVNYCVSKKIKNITPREINAFFCNNIARTIISDGYCEWMCFVALKNVFSLH